MNTPYYTDKEVRGKIDEVLHQAALLYARVGTNQLIDENGNKVDKLKDPMKWVNKMEIKLLKSVQHLDTKFFEPLLQDIKND